MIWDGGLLIAMQKVEGSNPFSRFEEGRTARRPESSRANADDRLPLASLGRIERRNGIVERHDVADVRPHASVPHSLDDLTQLGAVEHENEAAGELDRVLSAG
jgi:hypothetical protein